MIPYVRGLMNDRTIFSLSKPFLPRDGALVQANIYSREWNSQLLAQKIMLLQLQNVSMRLLRARLLA